MPRPITSTDLRSRYIEFFVEKSHAAIPSASLVPTNDPTVLFTTAGMHPLVPNLLGEAHPGGRRLVNVQRCIRTGDIDVIGDDTHLTFFEMLGNWSLGDYFRDDAIRWSFEFLTGERWLGLSLDRLGVTCFGGDADVPRDLESARLWEQLGIRRIQFLGRDDNWWGPAGNTGPCGPDTEIFYWVGTDGPPDVLDVRDRRWVEIWNNVFMGYAKSASGAIVPLVQTNVDTGMGLERTLMALGGMRSVYEVDTVAPLLDELRALTRMTDREKELRVMTDHLRAACLLIGDGVAPTNKDRGYVVRRLLRRCLLFARQLGMPSDWYQRGIERVVAVLGDAYPQLARDPASISKTIADEVERFDHTLAQGLKVLDARTSIDGAVAFDLLQTFGFPFELTLEVAERQGKHVDRDGFLAEMDKHRARSRGTARGVFAGGLADDSVEIVRYHTLTHLLHAALREVLGPHVIQRGSNITRERLRFDFSHDRALSSDELVCVQGLVNGWIRRPLVVDRATMSEPEARALGALGAFGEKYGAVVSVYTITDRDTGEVVSREFCGGPHVRSIEAELRGLFRIVREQGISTGVRRVRAALALH